MSLKAIHILFILASMGITIFFGIWSARQYFTVEKSPIYMAYIGASVFCLAILVVYGRYFLKKLKNISYL